MPHSIAVDPKDGAVWVTDVGLHQALKFDEHGTQLLALGQPLQPGHDTEHLCKPTAVRCRLAPARTTLHAKFSSPSTAPHDVCPVLPQRAAIS